MKKLSLLAATLCLVLTACQSTPSAPVQVTPELQKLRGFHQITPNLITSGIPTKRQFREMANSGVEVVINLLPDSHTIAYKPPMSKKTEQQLVTEQGMEYVYLPIDWEKPTAEDVDAFNELMAQYQGKSILVHCLANYRASAFVYMHLKQQGEDVSIDNVMKPWNDLQQSFKEYPQWEDLIKAETK